MTGRIHWEDDTKWVRDIFLWFYDDGEGFIGLGTGNTYKDGVVCVHLSGGHDFGTPRVIWIDTGKHCTPAIVP